MTQADFDRRAGETLDALFEQIDDQLGDWLEVDMTGGILQVELPDGGTYVINRHAPNREVWMSSPKSGAWHFAADDQGAWRSTRGGREALLDLLSQELSSASGRTVELDI